MTWVKIGTGWWRAPRIDGVRPNVYTAGVRLLHHSGAELTIDTDEPVEAILDRLDQAERRPTAAPWQRTGITR